MVQPTFCPQIFSHTVGRKVLFIPHLCELKMLKFYWEQTCTQHMKIFILDLPHLAPQTRMLGLDTQMVSFLSRHSTFCVLKMIMVRRGLF